MATSTAPKYHISPDGRILLCTATYSCRFGRNYPHYSSEAEAEEALAEEYRPLDEQSPSDVDGIIEQNDEVIFTLQREYEYKTSELERSKTALRLREERGNLTDESKKYLLELIEKEDAAAKSILEDIKPFEARIEEAEAEYRARGGWTRAFLVANKNGHVHRNRACSTCTPTTRYVWLTEYSGLEEDRIVDDAGERACTVCYPSAPVEVLNRATRIYSADERKAQEAAAERKRALEEKKAANAAKAVYSADGHSFLIYREFGDRTGGYWRELKTERAAEMAAVDIRAHQTYAYNRLDPNSEREQVHTEDFNLIVDALAKKRNVDREEVLKVINAKAAKKNK